LCWRDFRPLPRHTVILTNLRTQSHTRHRPQLWILDQVQDDDGG
jgi:hypothetical protein